MNFLKAKDDAVMTQFDSKTTPAVQLAPVMIGGGHRSGERHDATTRPRALEAQEVIALYADHQLIPCCPRSTSTSKRRFHQGTQAAEVINYFAENSHKT